MDNGDNHAKLLANLAPGAVSGGGFMGTDTRALEEIIESDRLELALLGLTPRQVGEKLFALSTTALSALGGEVEAGGLLVSAQEARGGLVCPFGEGGLLPKAWVTAKKVGSKEVLGWSLLGAHLVLEHSFFGGRGSAFRLEPAQTAKFLALQ